MPSTVVSVMAAAGLRPEGVVRWGEGLPKRSGKRSGIYVVSLSSATRSRSAALTKCPVSLPAVRRWLEVQPQLTLDDEKPTATQLAAAMRKLWLPDEVVLYIGKADNTLNARIRAYYRTPLGARQPHAGGHFLKALASLDRLWVHYTFCQNGEDLEAKMIRSFASRVSKKALALVRDPAHPFPFANSVLQELDPITGRRRRYKKDHGLEHDKAGQVRRGPRLK